MKFRPKHNAAKRCLSTMAYVKESKSTVLLNIVIDQKIIKQARKQKGYKIGEYKNTENQILLSKKRLTR